MPTCPPDPLVEPAQLPRYGVPADFLAQFRARAVEVQISTGGALGTMAVAWRWRGETDWSTTVLSSAGASWSWTIDDAWLDVTFATATYTGAVVLTVDEGGTVTGTGSSNVTASRYDLRALLCGAVSTEAMTLMRDAIRPPLTAWGDDARMHAAAWVFARLKRAKGLTPNGAGLGDETVLLGEQTARDFFRRIGEKGKPDSMTDTSPSSDGPLIPAYPSSDDARGW